MVKPVKFKNIFNRHYTDHKRAELKFKSFRNKQINL